MCGYMGDAASRYGYGVMDCFLRTYLSEALDILINNENNIFKYQKPMDPSPHQHYKPRPW